MNFVVRQYSILWRHEGPSRTLLMTHFGVNPGLSDFLCV